MKNLLIFSTILILCGCTTPDSKSADSQRNPSSDSQKEVLVGERLDAHCAKARMAAAQKFKDEHYVVLAQKFDDFFKSFKKESRVGLAAYHESLVRYRNSQSDSEFEVAKKAVKDAEMKFLRSLDGNAIVPSGTNLRLVPPFINEGGEPGLILEEVSPPGLQLQVGFYDGVYRNSYSQIYEMIDPLLRESASECVNYKRNANFDKVYRVSIQSVMMEVIK